MVGLNLPGVRDNPATTTKEELAKREEPKTLTPNPAPEPPTGEVVSEPTADDGVVRYSSHPILRYKIGRWRFENGLLELRERADVEEFEEILKKLPISERTRIKKLDVSAAEAQVRAVRETSPVASKAIGSETGDRDPGKQVGKGTLEDSNQ